MSQLAQIIAALQTQLDALNALQDAAPQFTQADVDAATAAGHAQGLVDAANVLSADLAKLQSDVVAALASAPAAPAAPSS